MGRKGSRIHFLISPLADDGYIIGSWNRRNQMLCIINTVYLLSQVSTGKLERWPVSQHSFLFKSRKRVYGHQATTGSVSWAPCLHRAPLKVNTDISQLSTQHLQNSELPGSWRHKLLQAGSESKRQGPCRYDPAALKLHLGGCQMLPASPMGSLWRTLSLVGLLESK